MNGYNKVILAGNLTRDPEMRYTQKGTAIANFGLAINRKWKDESGPKEEVTFVDVSAFGKQAEAIGQYLKKGRAILLEGRLKTESWEDKQTQQKRSKLGVVLESFTFIGSGEDRQDSAPRRERPAAEDLPAGTKAAQVGSLPPEEDDVPF